MMSLIPETLERPTTTLEESDFAVLPLTGFGLSRQPRLHAFNLYANPVYSIRPRIFNELAIACFQHYKYTQVFEYPPNFPFSPQV